MRKLLQFSLGLILCLPCFGQDYITVTTSPSGCVKDGSGTAIASARLTVQATDATNKPVPFRIGTGTASALISQVGRDITAGSLATSLQLGNPATTAPVNIRYHFAFKDNTTNQTTNWSLVSLVANDSGNFNLCKFDPSLNIGLPPLVVSSFDPGAVRITPFGDQTITVGSLFIPQAKLFGWSSDTGISRASANVIDFGNGTQADFSAAVQAAEFRGIASGNQSKWGYNAVISGNGVLGFGSGAQPGSNDTGFSRNSAGLVNVGNGTAGSFNGQLVGAGLIASDGTNDVKLNSTSARIGSAGVLGFSSTAAGSATLDTSISRGGSPGFVLVGNGTAGNASGALFATFMVQNDDASRLNASGSFAASNKVFGFSSTTSSGGSCDAGFSRISLGNIALGNCNHGNKSGILQLGGVTLFGSTSGSAPITVAATGGTLSIGSGSFTADTSGNITVNGCTGCGTVFTATASHIIAQNLLDIDGGGTANGQGITHAMLLHTPGLISGNPADQFIEWLADDVTNGGGVTMSQWGRYASLGASEVQTEYYHAVTNAQALPTMDFTRDSSHGPTKMLIMSLRSGVSTNEDVSGELTLAAASTISYTFLRGYSSHPECNLTPQFDIGSGVRMWITYTSTTSFTINFSSSVTGTVGYSCYGRN